MTFLALLTKELRLRMRRERTIWVIIVYILLMGLLGWFFITRINTNTSNFGTMDLSQAGTFLYYMLSMLQLFLIMFITPAFTSTAINGEKERQTFDLLLCSRLSAFSLVAGKLVAGLANALLLIAASVPLFSLVFFFGGVAPSQLMSALVVFVSTTIMLGTFGLLSSTLFNRPAVSTAITYMICLLWTVLPVLIAFLWTVSDPQLNANQITNLFVWNPVAALMNTYPGNNGIFIALNIGNTKVDLWITYTVLNGAATILFFLLSMWGAKPNPTRRLRQWIEIIRQKRKGKAEKASVTEGQEGKASVTV